MIVMMVLILVALTVMVTTVMVVMADADSDGAGTEGEMLAAMVMGMLVVAGVYGTILGARVKVHTLVGSFLPMPPPSSRLWR